MQAHADDEAETGIRIGVDLESMRHGRTRMKVGIVGGGIMGLSTAWALAREGAQVRLFEAGPLPQPLGSSHGPQRLIRHPYGDALGYTAMVDEAYRAWDRLWSSLGRSFHQPTGCLVLASESDDWLAASARSLRTLDIPHERLAPRQVTARFPLIRSEGLTSALYTPSGGALLAAPVLRALVAWLEEQPNVRLFPETRVWGQEIGPSGSATLQVGPREEPRELSVDALVIAAGPWSARLVPALAQRITTTRQVEAHFVGGETRSSASHPLTGYPMILDLAPEVGFYFVPPVAGLPAKTGDHRFGSAGNPDDAREASRADITSLVERSAARIGGLPLDRIQAGPACYYSVTEDERFIATRLDEAGRCWSLAGFSGHGFKFGPAVGLRMAAVLVGGASGEAFQRWLSGQAEADPHR